jgi:hypothetical protein
MGNFWSGGCVCAHSDGPGKAATIRHMRAIDIPVEPFRSAPQILVRSAAMFFSNLSFLAAVTLIVYLPAKLGLQLACYALDVPTSGILSFVLLDLSDLVLGALVAPAAIYGLVELLRSGKTPSVAESLRRGRARWGSMLWNQFKVEITIMLWGALLIVPGVMAMVRLIFVEPVVAIEDVTDPLERSRELTRGHRWRIFLTIAPLGLMELVGSFVVLNRLEDAVHSRVVMAVADSLLAVAAQWMTAAVLLLYLSIRAPEVRAASPVRTRRSGYRG